MDNVNNLSTPMMITAWLIPIFIGFLGLVVLWKIWKGDIKLAGLINESSGEASMSRFQFLIFTFVIAASLFLIIINNKVNGQLTFPEIPSGIWTLLGISGGSYIISKGIQSKSEEEEKRIDAARAARPNNPPNPVQPNPVQPNPPPQG